MPPIKHHYTSYQRKHPEPSKPVSRKPPPVKTTTAPSSTSTTAPANVTTTSTSNEVKNSNSRNERRQVLSPAGLKDQAEMHARLQQAVKQQQVTLAYNVVVFACKSFKGFHLSSSLRREEDNVVTSIVFVAPICKLRS